MKHPSEETWMEYLYGEVSVEGRRELEQHLTECAECKLRLDEWQKTRRMLDTWKNPAASLPKAVPRRKYWWQAAAAVILLGVGIGIGWWGGRHGDLEVLRVQVQSDVRQAVKKEFEIWRAERQELFEALQTQQEATAEQLARLRQDLETVAVMAEAGLQSAQTRINKLVSLTKVGTE